MYMWDTCLSTGVSKWTCWPHSSAGSCWKWTFRYTTTAHNSWSQCCHTGIHVDVQLLGMFCKNKTWHPRQSILKKLELPWTYNALFKDALLHQCSYHSSPSLLLSFLCSLPISVSPLCVLELEYRYTINCLTWSSHCSQSWVCAVSTQSGSWQSSTQL